MRERVDLEIDANSRRELADCLRDVAEQVERGFTDGVSEPEDSVTFEFHTYNLEERVGE